MTGRYEHVAASSPDGMVSVTRTGDDARPWKVTVSRPHPQTGAPTATRTLTGTRAELETAWHLIREALHL